MVADGPEGHVSVQQQSHSRCRRTAFQSPRSGVDIVGYRECAPCDADVWTGGRGRQRHKLGGRLAVTGNDDLSLGAAFHRFNEP